ncbi:MAG: amidohydrolase [Clostridia bacterium]|nr:amidohydrolase [Clostridia bacterium]
MNSYINEISAKVIEIRRYLHAHPELAFEEINTSKYICKILDEFGIKYKYPIAKTGICALIKGGKPGKTILLRADMDALPIKEEVNCDFKSKTEGLMHACGHDAHTAIMLGAAYVLNKMKDELCGNVKIVFQPAEEGVGGAEPMIKEGVMENPTVDAAFAFHVTHLCKTGQILVKNGPVMGAPDEFDIVIKGKGGHGAHPEECNDPILTASDFITTLKEKLVLNNTVVTVTAVEGGATYNIIPDIALMKGTARSTDVDTRNILEGRIEEILKAVCKAHGCTYDYNFRYMYPITVNDEGMTNIVRKAAYKVLGKENVIEYDTCPMLGEDFSYFANLVPGAYIKLGINGNGKGEHALHSSKFDIDEDALKHGVKLAVQTVIDYLA